MQVVSFRPSAAPDRLIVLPSVERDRTKSLLLSNTSDGAQVRRHLRQIALSFLKDLALTRPSLVEDATPLLLLRGGLHMLDAALKVLRRPAGLVAFERSDSKPNVVWSELPAALGPEILVLDTLIATGATAMATTSWLAASHPSLPITVAAPFATAIGSNHILSQQAVLLACTWHEEQIDPTTGRVFGPKFDLGWLAVSGETRA